MTPASSRYSERLVGFRKYAFAPNSLVAPLSSSESEEVTMMTGTRLHRVLLRIRFNTSIPEMPGRFRSNNTNPGHGVDSPPAVFCRNSKASAPLSAICSRKFRPHCSSTSRITTRSVSLSSISRMESGSRIREELEISSPLSGPAGKGEAEGGSLARDGVFQPDAAAILLNDALADCQTNAASRILRPVM